MKFQRYGRSYQLVVENGVDLEEALGLDESLWAALMAPTSVFHCDQQLFKLMELETPGRLANIDLQRAIRWLLANLPDHSKITAEFDGNLPIDSIAATEEGEKLRYSARYVLKELQAADQEHISLEQVRTFLNTVLHRSLNGDGVISPKGAADPLVTTNPAILEMLNNVVASNGGAKDLDGTQGMDNATLDTYRKDAADYLSWLEKGRLPEGAVKSQLMPFGTDTPAMAAIVKANASKIEQYFQLCRLAEFDVRIQDRTVSVQKKVDDFDPADMAAVAEYQKVLPLATPGPKVELPTDLALINPTYVADYEALLQKVVKPLLEEIPAMLTPELWAKVQAAFAPYEAYLASKCGAAVEGIAPEVLKHHLEDEATMKEIATLMVKDKAVADIVAATHQVERLLLYRTYMVRLANNFISMSELYDSQKHALFESGRVIMDGRWFGIALQVESPAAHQVLAAGGQLFLMYIDVTLKNGVKQSFVIPVTDGSKGSLMVGKRGIYYNRDGIGFDAVITKIQENPVCVKEALLLPFTKIWNLVEGKITDWSNVAQKKFDSTLAAIGTGTPAPAPAPKPDAAKVTNPSNMLGITVAIAALGSAFAYVSSLFAKMSWLQILLTLVAALLVVMIPISVIAILKLRRQSLSSVLEGCGWALNLQMRLDRRLRRQFTYYAKYPRNAKGTPRSYWLSIILWVVLVGVAIGGCVRGCYWYKARKAEAEKQKAAALQQESLPQDQPCKPAPVCKPTENAPDAPVTPAAPAVPAK